MRLQAAGRDPSARDGALRRAWHVGRADPDVERTGAVRAKARGCSGRSSCREPFVASRAAWRGLAAPILGERATAWRSRAADGAAARTAARLVVGGKSGPGWR